MNLHIKAGLGMPNYVWGKFEQKKSIFLQNSEKAELRNEWIKNSIKNSNLILRNIEKERAWKDSNPRPPEP